MSPAAWGGLCALSLGGADFLARSTGRALGYADALFGVLAVGAVVVSLYVWIGGVPLVWPRTAGLWLLALYGVATAVTMLLLYNGLARGPVSVVAPIVAAHPALVVALAVVVLGARPGAVQWAAMGLTLAGTVVVARYAAEQPGATAMATGEGGDPAGSSSAGALRGTLAIAAAAAVAHAALVATGQAAVPIYGEVQTLWAGRLIGLAVLSLLYLGRRRRPRIARRWLPLVAAQGLLDAGGHLFLFAGSHGQGAPIAAVAGSTFGAVTTLLAYVVLRERIGAAQWGGVLMVSAGVATLAATG